MSSNNRRIQRVPALLITEEEDEKKNDYYPKVASIGPYHYGKTELAQVEAFKPIAVDLLVRSLEEKDFFYQKVLDMISRVRNCYEKESVDKYSDADLAQMMLRDASLIIAEMEIYLEHWETYHKRKAMIDHFGRLTGAVLFRDFILVENQIPLCVIQLLIELRYGADTAPEMINNYVNKCVNKWIFGEIRPIGKYSRVPLHLLEFMHIILVCDCVQPQESSRGSYLTGDIDIEDSYEENSNGILVGAPNHTLMLGSRKHATEASNWSIEESCSGELGAPGGPNLTLTLGPHKPPTETSSNRSILDEEEIVVVALDRTLMREDNELHMAPDHTLTLESPQYAIATVTSNKASPQHAIATVISNKVHSFRTVMELKARGIHFRPSATQSLLDVKFESGFFYDTLQLPEMFLSPYSKPFFKNLVAYELLPGVETEPTVTSYIKLMQLLVERPEDLEELRERKIVYNQLGSDEEALNVFKDINTHGASDEELYFRVREEMQKNYKNRIKTWIAELIHTHFRSPWTFTAFLAAAAVIALTAAQLYYGVHPVADKTPTSS